MVQQYFSPYALYIIIEVYSLCYRLVVTGKEIVVPEVQRVYDLIPQLDEVLPHLVIGDGVRPVLAILYKGPVMQVPIEQHIIHLTDGLGVLCPPVTIQLPLVAKYTRGGSYKVDVPRLVY
jgi:hypothetical protein